ncbi:MAG: ABC transporter substrate-binding protein [Alphaproteobacteria bacterium]
MKRYVSALTVAGGVAAALLLAAGPVNAETLKVGMRSMPPGEGNPYTGRGLPHVFVWTPLYDNLTEIGDGGVIEPALAGSWTNDSNLTWTFKLRPGVTFTNGEPLTAAAVKATYDWLQSEKGATTVIGKNMAPIVDSVTAVDDLTVEFKTKTPYPLASREFAAVHIVAPKAWADLGIEGFAKKPHGTGPYVAESFKPGQITINARADQANTIRPRTGNIDKIDYLDLGEGAARLQALQSGQIHIDTGAGIDDIPTLERGGFIVDSVPAGRTLGLSFVSYRGGKHVEGPIGDVRVRQALNYAVNKQAIVDNIYGGNATVASQAATTNAFGFNPDVKPYSYDPERAKKLLAEAGYPNGFEMEIQGTTTNPVFTLVYQSAVQDLNAVGIKANFVGQTFADWLKHWLAGDWPYDAFGFGHDLSGNLDAGRSFTSFTSCMKNPPYYCNEDEMDLVKRQAEEFDPDARLAILHELLAKNAANAPIIFLTQGIESMSISPKVKNFKQINQRLNYENMTLTN